MAKLQFAFGNPRGRKKVKKASRKSVAKRHKKRKTKSVKQKSRKAHSMAKRRRSKSKRKFKLGHKRKNPAHMLAYKTVNGKKKLVGSATFPLAHEIEAKLKKDPSLNKMKAQLKAMAAKGITGHDTAQVRLKILEVKKRLLSSVNADKAAKEKYMQRLQEEGAEIKHSISKERTKEKKVAKRKKRKSGKRKSRRVKKAKAAAPKRAKRRKSRKAKHSKRQGKRRSKKIVKVSAPKRHKRRKGKRKGGKRRRKHMRMVSHKHGSNIRHIKKGTSFRFKSKSKRGKRSVTVTGRVRVNPYRRNPSMADQVKTYTGMASDELGALALGAVLVPLINGGIAKVPGGASIVSAINGIVGAQAVGSVIPIGVGIALNAVAEHAIHSGPGNKYLKMAGEGLVAAGLIGLVMGLAQKYVNPMLGLSGINFTPNMRGINFTPNMGIMPQLNGGFGIMPQLNGMGATGDYGGNAGYHQQAADFGKVGNYGDFGADSSADSEYDTDSIDGDAHTTAMN